MLSEREVMSELDKAIEKLNDIEVKSKTQPDVVAISSLISAYLIVLEDFDTVKDYQKWKRETALPHDPRGGRSRKSLFKT